MKNKGLVALVAALGGCASAPKLDTQKPGYQPVVQREPAIPRGHCFDYLDRIANGALVYWVCDVDQDGKVDELTLDPPVTSCLDGRHYRTLKVGNCSLLDEEWNKWQNYFEQSKKSLEEGK